jgi:hypothetical protein
MSEKDIIFIVIVLIAYWWANNYEPKWMFLK